MRPEWSATLEIPAADSSLSPEKSILPAEVVHLPNDGKCALMRALTSKLLCCLLLGLAEIGVGTALAQELPTTLPPGQLPGVPYATPAPYAAPTPYPAPRGRPPSPGR